MKKILLFLLMIRWLELKIMTIYRNNETGITLMFHFGYYIILNFLRNVHNNNIHMQHSIFHTKLHI